MDSRSKIKVEGTKRLFPVPFLGTGLSSPPSIVHLDCKSFKLFLINNNAPEVLKLRERKMETLVLLLMTEDCRSASVDLVAFLFADCGPMCNRH